MLGVVPLEVSLLPPAEVLVFLRLRAGEQLRQLSSIEPDAATLRTDTDRHAAVDAACSPSLACRRLRRGGTVTEQR